MFVLHRLVPPPARDFGQAHRARAPAPATQTLDGLAVHYVRYVSPPRGRAYARWGAWAAPALARALRARSTIRRWCTHTTPCRPATPCCGRGVGTPLVVSRARRRRALDDLARARRARGRRARPRRRRGSCSPTAPGSSGSRTSTARATRASSTSAPTCRRAARRRCAGAAPAPLLVTVGHLVARKRHADVLEALRDTARRALPGDRRRPGARARSSARAARSASRDRVEFAGQLAPPGGAATRPARRACFVMPSTEEAFGVAYIEAMAAGMPGDRLRRRAGPRGDRGRRRRHRAGRRRARRARSRAPAPRCSATATRAGARRARRRATVEREFTWKRCGEQTRRGLRATRWR